VLAATSEANLTETLGAVAARAPELPLYGLRLVVHQRLVPVLCPECRVECVLGTADKQAISDLVPSTVSVFQEGKGCTRCGGRGTGGLRVFFEVLTVDASVREALYGEARGERRIDGLCRRVQPSIRAQVAEAVARGEVSLAELWEAT
jgi:type II secretory ATPase GspE/PulE/Tfp pilus assembly ATPase PilB-like protein